MKKVFLFLIFFSTFIFCQEQSNSVNIGEYEKYLIVGDMRDSQPPSVKYINGQKHLFVTYNPSYGDASYVAVATDFDNFSKLYVMEKNINNIYFAFIKIPPKISFEKKPIKYSMIIDGIWTYDEKNPNVIQNINATPLSIFSDYKEEEILPPNSPVVKKINRKFYSVKFYFQAKPDNPNIFLYGSFNNWDPFMYKLKQDKKEPRRYYIELFLNKGEYEYTFLYEGQKKIDQQNKKIVYGKNNEERSLLVIK